jgi:hypothetical protein
MSLFSTSRIAALVLAASFAAASVVTASAQTPATPAPTTSKIKLTAEKLKAMKEKWSSNRPKLKACQKDVKSKGLAGDDRWFYIEDCMSKT